MYVAHVANYFFLPNPCHLPYFCKNWEWIYRIAAKFFLETEAWRMHQILLQHKNKLAQGKLRSRHENVKSLFQDSVDELQHYALIATIVFQWTWYEALKFSHIPKYLPAWLETFRKRVNRNQKNQCNYYKYSGPPGTRIGLYFQNTKCS